jgi:hypothetical protein
MPYYIFNAVAQTSCRAKTNSRAEKFNREMLLPCGTVKTRLLLMFSHLTRQEDSNLPTAKACYCRFETTLLDTATGK